MTSSVEQLFFSFPPFHKKANKAIQRWHVLAFSRIAPNFKPPKSFIYVSTIHKQQFPIIIQNRLD